MWSRAGANATATPATIPSGAVLSTQTQGWRRWRDAHTLRSMLGRYQIIRGKRPADRPLPEGMRIDVRKHTKHFLRPDPALVAAVLEDPSAKSFQRFRTAYRSLLAERFRSDRAAFDELVELARRGPVYLGCNCPTKKQPEVIRCHTVLALEFLAKKYPDLEVQLPEK